MLVIGVVHFSTCLLKVLFDVVKFNNIHISSRIVSEVVASEDSGAVETSELLPETEEKSEPEIEQS